MDLIHSLLDFILHIDKHLTQLISQYGTLTYFILFAIIFCETGFVVTPFLPGDSMLFAAGAIAALDNSGLNIMLLAVLLIIAAFTGNMLNYFIGKSIGPKVYEKDLRLIRRSYLDRTKNFFAKYGSMTIIYTRFAPILRTFAPFIAGVGQMKINTFIIYNFIGGFLWVVCFLAAGYFFGNITFVKDHFETVVIGIILISFIPAGYAFFKTRFGNKEMTKK
ncbi:MAG: DedA family protein [Chitinophagales bacterium]|nr:DedA family protein [Chitinophagales bacterium]